MTTQALTLTTNTQDAIANLLASDPRLASPHTRRAYAHDLAQFETWRNGRPMTKLLVEQYAAELLASGMAAKSVNRHLTAIRWWARKVGDLAHEQPLDPAARAEVVTQAARVAAVQDVKAHAHAQVGRHVTLGEIDAIMRAVGNDQTPAGVRDAALLALGAATGMRRAELASLTLDALEIAPDGATLTVQGKGGKERLAHLFNGALDALTAWLRLRGATPGPLFNPIRKGGHLVPGATMTTQALADVLAKRAQQAAVKPLTWHDLRRSFAGDLLGNGIDVSTVQKLMGHASPITTTAYDRRPEQARKAALQTRHVPYYANVTGA